MPAGTCGPAKPRQTGVSPAATCQAASLLLGQRMVLGDEGAQPLLEHVGVDLRRRDVGVAEELLHDAEIGAVLQEVAGEGVAEHVRRDLRRRDAGRDGKLLEVAGERLAGQVAALAEGREQPRAVGAAGRLARREIGGRPLPAPCRSAARCARGRPCRGSRRSAPRAGPPLPAARPARRPASPVA